MPKKISISKDNILNTALEIVREKGIEFVSNREIAKKLNCSIRPIYYQFENSEEQLEYYQEQKKEIEKLEKSIKLAKDALEQAYSSFEAGRMEGESVKWNEASGRISLEYVYLYPPGIPMIVPGERITSTIVQKMVKYKDDLIMIFQSNDAARKTQNSSLLNI